MSKTSSKADSSMLVTVAESIGATLGTIAAKANTAKKTILGEKRARKASSTRRGRSSRSHRPKKTAAHRTGATKSRQRRSVR